MRLDIEGRTLAGAAIDLRERRVDRASLVAAIRNRPSPYAVACPTPGPVHERAGVIVPGMGLKARTALAAAARSRGVETAEDDRIDRIASDLADLSDAIEASADPPPDGPPPAEVADVRERAAELRGQVAALEAADADPTDARATLREAATRLSELETERIAAEQRRERARERRDRRERRLRLEDELANARRDARAALVAAVRPEYERAVAEVHGETTEPFAVPAPVAALAVCRVATVRAPVVLDLAGDGCGDRDAIGLDIDRFDDEFADGRFADGRSADAERAADWLDAPVIRL